MQCKMAASVKRMPTCTRCRYHEDIDIPLKGHKNHCPYKECECSRCGLIMKRRMINVAQQELHRQHNPKKSVLNAENNQAQKKNIRANPSPEPHPISEKQSCAVGRFHYYNGGPGSQDVGGGDHRDAYVCYNGISDLVCVNGDGTFSTREQGDGHINSNLAYLIRLFPEHPPRYLEYILECYPNDMQTAIEKLLPLKQPRQLVWPGNQLSMHLPCSTQPQNSHMSTTQPQLQARPGGGFVDLYKLVSAQNAAAVTSTTLQSVPQHPTMDYALSLAHSEYAQAGNLQEPRNKNPSPDKL